jgi:hypothetical protein
MSKTKQAPPDPSRHETVCKLCGHANRGAIEQAFLDWESPDKLAAAHGISRDSVYRHAHALGLFEKRQRNVRRVLERILERAGDVDVTAAAVVAAVQAYAKINSQGQWVDRSESLNLNELFERMSWKELEAYAREGALPEWFTQVADATAAQGQENAND